MGQTGEFANATVHVAGAFDENNLRLHLVQHLLHHSGTGRTVVPHANDGHAHPLLGSSVRAS